MQYILHDLIKVPLAERLILIEKAITSIGDNKQMELLNEAMKKEINTINKSRP